MINRQIIVGIIVAVVAILILIIALVGSSLSKLSSKEMGVQYNTIERDLGDEVFSEGLHLGPVGYEFIKFPNVFTSMSLTEMSCLNNGGVRTTLDVTFQYRVKRAKLREVILLFKDFEKYEDMLTREAFAGVHEGCSHFNTTEFQSRRGEFENNLGEVIAARYERAGCEVEGIQVNNIQRPDLYEKAIRNKEQVKEDIEVAEQERPRQKTEAETEREEAKLEAQIIIGKANSEAKILNELAKKNAEAITKQYEKEAEAYEAIMGSSGLGFSAEAFISYMGVRVISDAKNPVYIGLNGPAKSSYVKT